MTMTLQITDNADSTGATANISGAGGGATVTVYARVPGKQDFFGVGSRTGSGTLPLNVGVISLHQLYQAYAVGSDNTETAKVGFYATDDGESVQYRIIMEVARRIVNLNLRDVGNNVFPQLKWLDTKVVYPGVLIAPASAERITLKDTHQHEVVYSAGIAMCDNESPDSSANLSRLLGWREQVLDEFMRAKTNVNGKKVVLENCPEVLRTTVGPELIVNVDQGDTMPNVASGITLLAITQRTRKGA